MNEQPNRLDSESPSLPLPRIPSEQLSSDNLVLGKEFEHLPQLFRDYMHDTKTDYHETIPEIERVLNKHPELLPRLIPATGNVDYANWPEKLLTEVLVLAVDLPPDD